MAINYTVYNNETGRSATVQVDFVTSLLVNSGSYTTGLEYFLKFTTSARDTGNVQIKPKVVKDLSDLALNGTKHSISNVGTDYSDIKGLVEDYVYDMINGHTANQFSSGAALQLPMNI